MSRYKKSTRLPLIAAAGLLAVFFGIVFWATRGDDEKAIAPPVVHKEPAAERAPSPEPEVAPESEPELTAAEANRNLRRATKKWRAFTLALCRKEKWPTERAVAFLQRVTWNDRDAEKQHLNGLTSLGRMLGADTTDPVALATALEKELDLNAFFEQNWPKVDVPDWKPEEKTVVLEDRWKPSRIRWGFPLDTPVADLKEFKSVGLTVALQAWQSFAITQINSLEIDDGLKSTKARNAIGDDFRTQEIKMRAAFRVLLEMPGASIRTVAEELLKRAEAGQDHLAKTMLEKMDAALKAAEEAQ